MQQFKRNTSSVLCVWQCKQTISEKVCCELMRVLCKRYGVSVRRVVCLECVNTCAKRVVCLECGNTTRKRVVCLECGNTSVRHVVCFKCGNTSAKRVVCFECSNTSVRRVVCFECGNTSVRRVVCFECGNTSRLFSRWLLRHQDTNEVISNVRLCRMILECSRFLLYYFD